MNYLFLVAVLLCLCARCCFGDFHLPAEFDSQAAIWVTWSSQESKKGYSYSFSQSQIIRALAPHIPLKVFVCNDEEIKKAKNFISKGLKSSKPISYHVLPSDNIWLRDISSTFLVNEKGEKAIVDFQFNSWSSQPFLGDLGDMGYQHDACFRRDLAHLLNLHLIPTEVISEGGNRETNGRGTLIVVEAVDRQRNPHLTPAQLAEEYKRILGVKKVIWLKKGMIQDDHIFNGPVPACNGSKTAYTTYGNGGHVDAFCRFVDPQTIILAEVDEEEAKADPIAFENSLRLQESYEILKNSTDQDGNPFRILRMPTTHTFYVKMGPQDPIYQYLSSLNFSSLNNPVIQPLPRDKEALFLVATSYLNFLISDQVILVPKYWKKGYPKKIKNKDKKVVQILKRIFPDKSIIQIDAFNLNLCGGGIHCATQHEPLS